MKERCTTLTQPATFRDIPTCAGESVRIGNKKVRMNIWDNLYGYEGSKRVKEFGGDHHAAADFLNGVKQSPLQHSGAR